jgi:hypothetical protein
LKYLKDKIYELSFKMNLQVPLEGKYWWDYTYTMQEEDQTKLQVLYDVLPKVLR